MPVLDCSVKNCYYNKSNKCCLNDIDVAGVKATVSDETACNSFRPASDGTVSNCCDTAPTPSANIHCKAKQCCFNENCNCTAKHISINGQNAHETVDTCCASFALDK